MLQAFLVRLLSLCIWLPAVGLTFFLIAEFTEGQSAVVQGIAMMALLVSAVSLLVAAFAFKRGDKLYGWASISTYILGLTVMAFLETGFWNSTIFTSHTRLQRADAAVEGAEMLAARQRAAISAGTLAETPAEFQAKMDAQLSQPVGNQPLGRITSNCADTQSAAYRLCGDYLSLKAAKAKAEAREKAETRIWEAGTKVIDGGLKRDIFSGAAAVAAILGGRPEVWAGIFSLVMVLLLTAARDLAALGAFGPSNAGRKAKTIQGEVVPVHAAPLSQVEERELRAAMEQVRGPVLPTSPQRLGAMVEDIHARLDAAQAPKEPREPILPPTNGGTRKSASQPAPEAAQAVSEEKLTVVPFNGRNIATLPSFASDLFEESHPPRKHTAERRRQDRRKLAVGAAKRWLQDCTMRSVNPAKVVSREDAWRHYRAWCHDSNFRELPQSTFHRTVNAKIGSANNSYVGLVLTDEEHGEHSVRAVA